VVWYTVARRHGGAGRRLIADLLASAKNAAEHKYSVESVRELLAPLCDS
jgi:isochorismate synthase EntC